VDRIGAPRVWAEKGDTGQGIVIASVDTSDGSVTWESGANRSTHDGFVL
jgi:hypothetical protein